ncbi:MAG: hypothetical protein M5U28_44430 [Sandaracinaceae bacterium]|nr:hypothetical protein [Sandaracinaceae bacterium]
MSAEAAARLAHDVGKYVARVARNVSAGAPVPSALLPMLARDLYELPGGQRASARFEALAGALGGPRVERARASLAAIDALEARVRAAEPEACREACALALEVERELRALAREARG